MKLDLIHKEKRTNTLLYILRFFLFSITKGKIQLLTKFEFLLLLPLHYGTFVLALLISILLYRTKQQP